MEEFVKKIHEVYPLTDEEVKVLLDQTELIVLPKGSRVMTAGKVEHNTYFIVEGLARGFFYQEGKDYHLVCFGGYGFAVYEWLCVWESRL